MKIQERRIKICHMTLKVLKYSLMWPSEENEMNPGIWYGVRIAFFFIIPSFWIFSVATHVVIAVKNDLDVSVSEDIAFLTAFLGLYTMCLSYVKNQSKIATLFEDLSTFKFGKPSNYDETAKKIEMGSYFSFFYALFATIGYNFFKLLQKPSCEQNNIEKGLKETCGLLTQAWFPFEINYFPVFHITLFYVFLSTLILVKLGLIISYNALEVAHYIIIRIEHLDSMLIACFDDKNYETSRDKLRICVKYHLHIIDFTTRFDDCFKIGMFAHLTITAVICGCLEKQYVDGYNRGGSVLHGFGWILALFVACLGGQHLINAGDSIPSAIWSSKWYQADVRLRRDILFVLARSQKGLKLNAGAFSVVGFPLFVSVLKMSYSILAMLKS